MRILLRRYDGEEYVWKEATYKKENFFVDDNAIEECNIAATDGHSVEGCVICSYCGEIVKNTPEEIAAHYAKRESGRDCINCDKVYVGGIDDTLTRNITDNGDGTYNVVTTEKAKLYCRMGYSKYEISTESAKDVCKFMLCRQYGMREASDFFSKYPDAFDSVITVDTIVAQKYNYYGKTYLSYGSTRRELHMYDMKSRGTIQACVNSSGIVECFKASSAGSTYYFFYSEKYDKLFWAKYGTYREGRPDYCRQAKLEELHNKVKALYAAAKEEKK